MCSTIATPAPNRIVCAGRLPSLSSSILSESIPTSATLAFARYSAASRVTNGCWPAECVSGDVTAVLVPMERRIDVRAGIGEQLDLADLEGRARTVPRL